jgi:hypothetical protein
MKINLMTMVAIIGLTAATARAQDPMWSQTTGFLGDRFSISTDPSRQLFNTREFSLDIFGSAYDNDRRIGSKVLQGQWGGGVGGRYFFTRELGMSLDTNISDNGHSFLDYIHASAVFRYPIEEIRLAPYAFAGIGCELDPRDEFSFHGGFGAEYRLNPLTGLFLDTRYVFADRAKDYWVFRLGLRFVF